jgi:DNA-directed RNA polymerase subunit M/transcription elongation factor TFIIS
MDAPLFGVPSPNFHHRIAAADCGPRKTRHPRRRLTMAKIAKTADRKKIMDTTKSTDCPKCGKPTRIVKRVKDRERNTPGGIFISCSGCEFHEKL